MTLPELLIVTVIVSLLAGIALLGFDMHNPQRTLEREAERLRLILSMAEERALITGAEYGVYLGEKEYQLLEYDGLERQWLYSGAPMFQSYRLPEYLELVLEMEDRPVLPLRVIDGDGNSGEGGYETPAPPPQIQIYSSGELTPFDIFLKPVDGSRRYRISGDGIRPIRLEKIDHPGHATY